MPTLGRIAIYPLKSFDPILVDKAVILASGAIQHDRQFAFIDAAGKFLNAKRTALIHPLEVQLDPGQRTIIVRRRTEVPSQLWQIDSDRSAIEQWFSQFFSTQVTLVENDTGGFPDDNEAAGPTIVSQATLKSVAGWFPGLTLDQIRLRFRPNLEIVDVVPFWEDHLYGASAEVACPFRIGEVLLAGTNPCQRCVVPTRDPATGEVWPEFAKRFAELREAHLPEWAPRTRFHHFYRLTVNTRLVGRGSGQIQVGDPIDLVHLEP